MSSTWFGERGKIPGTIYTVPIAQDPFQTKSQVEALIAAVASPNTFTFSQDVPSDVWVITHTLSGKHPSVVVVDSAGTVVVGDIQYSDTNEVTITFSLPFSGKAYLN